MEIARTELTAEDIGVRLRAVRELTGLTVGQVSKASGVSRREINAAEHGRRVLGASAMRAVAGALGVAPGVLVSSLPHSKAEAGRRRGLGPHRRRRGGARSRALARPAGDTRRPARADPVRPAVLRAPHRRRHARQGRAVVGRRRGEMHDVLEAATRLAMCGSGDDPMTLMRNVTFEVDKLQRKRSFQMHVARHQAEVLEARSATQGTDPAA
ncbi:MAG: helix-turn-helix transcriptional regulator [Acidimicrobiia bacterium]